MDKRIEKLHEWGCDIDAAIERMMDDEKFYIECLGNIINDDNFLKLYKAIEDKRINDAFDCAHTLKGVFANLSLTPMYEKVVEIVEPLRAGNINNLSKKLCELKAMKEHLTEIMKEA